MFSSYFPPFFFYCVKLPSYSCVKTYDNYIQTRITYHVITNKSIKLNTAIMMWQIICPLKFM